MLFWQNCTDLSYANEKIESYWQDMWHLSRYELETPAVDEVKVQKSSYHDNNCIKQSTNKLNAFLNWIINI